MKKPLTFREKLGRVAEGILIGMGFAIGSAAMNVFITIIAKLFEILIAILTSTSSTHFSS